MRIKYFLMSVIFAFASIAQGKVASLDESKIRSSINFQKTPEWCWAASIEFALNYYGFNISQEDIVERTFGSRVIMPGNWLQMTNNLNFFGKTADDKNVLVSATVYMGSPTGEAIVNQLKEKKPIIMAFSHQFGGHAVVVTGVNYRIINNRAIIDHVTLFDPFPYSQQHVDNGGKVEIGNYISPTNIWFVDATEEESD